MKTVSKLKYRSLRHEMCSQFSTHILDKLNVQSISELFSKPTPHSITFLRFKIEKYFHPMRMSVHLG
jgi:hypothetical protein